MLTRGIGLCRDYLPIAAVRWRGLASGSELLNGLTLWHRKID